MISAADPAIGTAVYELSLRLAGDLYEPGSTGYEDACALFNSMIERRPALVARCSAPTTWWRRWRSRATTTCA